MFLQGDKNQSNFASFFTAFQTETLPKKQSNHGFSTGQISLIFIVEGNTSHKKNVYFRALPESEGPLPEDLL